VAVKTEKGQEREESISVRLCTDFVLNLVVLGDVASQRTHDDHCHNAYSTANTHTHLITLRYLYHTGSPVFCNNESPWSWGTVIRGLMRGMATLAQGNQELLVVLLLLLPPGELGVSKSVECDIFLFSALTLLVGSITFRIWKIVTQNSIIFHAIHDLCGPQHTTTSKIHTINQSINQSTFVKRHKSWANRRHKHTWKPDPVILPTDLVHV